MRRAVLVTMLLCGSPQCAHSNQSPARLLEGEYSIESRLRIPKELEPGRYTVQCEAWIRRSGRVRTFVCYSAHVLPHNLVATVTAAGRRARFAPATRDGMPVDVYMLLMVRIDITDQGALVLVVPNNGVEAARYGLLYTAPQRFNEFEWGRKNLATEPQRVLIWQKLKIDEHGKVLEYVVTNSSGAPEWVVKEVKDGIERMEFMPGLFEGKPVPMFYVEPAFCEGD